MDPTLQIRLLGDFAVLKDGVSVNTLGAPRLQALFAYLVLHSHAPQRRDQVAFALWPDSSETHARLSLRQLMHLLRRALPVPGGWLHSDSETIQWMGDPSSLDVYRFNSLAEQATEAERTSDLTCAAKLLEEAAALYRGDLLPGLFDEWLLSEREHLRRLFVGVLHRLVRILGVQASHAEAIPYAHRLVEAEPFDEEGYRLLMRLHAAGGDRSAVVRAYRHCQTLLWDGLGVEPSPLTQTLYNTLLSETSPALPWNNLPAQTTMFIGRERELAVLADLLSRPEARLVTLVGPAGIGKTRLSMEVAARVAPRFRQGVLAVSLSSIADPGLVVLAIAKLLALREVAGRPLINTIADYLRDRQLLLILDNFEHLATAAPVLAQLLDTCPGLKILVTSRVLLRLYGEREFAVPPLQLPASGHLASLEELARCESVALFIDRVRMSTPDFALTARNAPPIAEICRRLEGLPLAVELAASRTKLLSPSALLARLGSRLDLLVGGAPHLPPRQQTLRGAIDWSYGLLGPAEQTLLRRLAVFTGGCSIEAAEAVCREERADVVQSDGGRSRAVAVPRSHTSAVAYLDLVGSLVDKSLLRREVASGDEPRFYMLETIREYAREQLIQNGELEAAQRCHAGYYISYAEAAEPHLTSVQPDEWLERLEVEHSNLRAALEYVIEAGMAEGALRMSGALRWFWEMRGHLSEGRQYLERVLSMPTTALDQESGAGYLSRAMALNAAGAIAYELQDYAAARQYHEESLALRRAVGDLQGVASSLNNLGTVAKREADYPRAEALLLESIARCRETADLRVMSIALTNLAEVALYRADYERARSLFEEALALCRKLGIARNTANVLNSLARLTGQTGDYGRAAALGQEALATYRRLGDLRYTDDALLTLAEIWARQGEIARASLLYREAVASCQARDAREVESARALARLADILRPERPHMAALLLGAVEAHLSIEGRGPEEIYRAGNYHDIEQARPKPGDNYWPDLEAGRALSLDEALSVLA